MKNVILPLIACYVSILSFAQVTIEHCQEKAKSNYPLIKQYDLINKSTEYTISNANKAYLPQVSLNAIGAYIIRGLPTASIPGAPPPEEDKVQVIGIGQFNQTIWDGGGTRAQKDIVRAGSEVEKSNVDVAMHGIAERVNQLFFGILLIEEQIKLLNLTNETLTRNLKSLTLSKENGIAYQTDVDEIKSETLNIDQRRIEFGFTRKGYLEMLSYLIGEPLLETVQLIRPEAIESVTSLSNNRPELGLYSNQIKLVGAQSAVNKVMNMPKVGLLATGVWINPGASFGTSKITSISFAGLSVSWNTAGIYKTSNLRQLDKISTDRIANQQETFLFTNNLQLRQSNSEIEKQKAIVGKDEEIVVLKGGIRKSYQLKYDNGICSMNDLINAIQKESEASNNRALHEVQLLMNIYNYKTTTGN